MQIPSRIPGLKLATTLMGLYFVVWIGLEGRLWQVVLLGAGTTAVSLLHLLQEKSGGRVVSLGRWLGLTAVFGLFFGLGSGLFTLFFMALKTGLHAHGPEFTLLELQWVIQQIPLWTVVGLLAGTGLGLITAKQPS